MTYRLNPQTPKIRWFYCLDGEALKSIEDLLYKLQRETPEKNRQIFEYHTQEHGNDFAAWIKKIFVETQLAKKIEQTKTPDELKKILKDFIEKCKTQAKEDDKKAFIFYYGVTMRNLEDFAEELRKFSPDYHINSFKFHMKNNGNDFANWIKDVLNDKKTAEKIRNLKTPEQVLQIIEETIAENTKKQFIDETPEITKKTPEFKIDKEKQTFIENSELMQEKMKQMKKNSRKNLTILQTKEILEEEYKTLITQLSDARKKGKDVFIPSLKIKNLKPKIQYAQITGKQEDIENVQNLMKNINQEIQECLEYEPPNIKKEVEEAYKKEQEQLIQTQNQTKQEHTEA